jgi:CO/xanthine dehydrogenase Mo-binding subunit
MVSTNNEAIKTGDFDVIGTRPIRHDGVDKVTGRAAYGADIHLPGMTYAAVLRSPHAHAKILSIDISQAEALPGVAAVITGADFPDPGEHMTKAGEGGSQKIINKSADILARSKVHYQGHPVAAVSAKDLQTAEEAARLIKVDYDVLSPVMTAEEAIDDGAPIIMADLRTKEDGIELDGLTNISEHTVNEEGDLEIGFADADVIIESEFHTSAVHQGFIEPMNATAWWRDDGTVDIWGSSQGHFGIRDEVSDLLLMPVSKIRVIPMEIGGGFGGKTTTYLEPLAAVLSRKSGRPVKMTMTREEVLKATGPTPGTWEKVKLGMRKDGKITAAHVILYFEAGGFPGSVLGAGVITALSPYGLENMRIDGYEVLVNKSHTGAYRAPGATMSEYAVETVVDEACEKLGLDPMEIRLQNASVEGDMRVDGLPFPKIGTRETTQAIKDSDHWHTPLEHAAETHLKRGRGMASGYWMNGGAMSSAQAIVNADGSVTLREGSMDIGGTRTSVAMQLAETLGIAIEDVHPVVPDTDSIAFTGVTGGSRVTYATGYAAHLAAEEVLAQMVAGMAQVWDVDENDVNYENTTFTAQNNSATFKEAAALMDQADILVTGSSSIAPNRPGPAISVQLVDVEVDTETGKVEILRYTAAQDAGIAIYPPYVEGQIQGGVVQGIGWALNEEYWFDEDGRMRNSSLLDYRMPTAPDVPMIETIIVEVPNPGHPYGVRGVGEVPIVPPPAAIANAIYDAVGVRMRVLPMSPASVVKALGESNGNAINSTG